jgi:hypothetical protein
MQIETDLTLENLETLSRTGLKKGFGRLYGKPPPKQVSSEFLTANIAYRLQENQFGGLTDKTKKRLTRIAKELEKDPTYDPAPKQDIRAGTCLIREWQGEIYEVTVLEEGFEYQSQRFRSLSKIAFEITGTKWSGPAFFGLKKKGA